MAKARYLGFRGKTLNNALLWLVIFPAFTLFGYNQGVANGLLNLPSWVATFPSISSVDVDPSQEVENARIQGTVVAIYTAAGLFGALACIWLGDSIGRRKTIFLGALFALVGSLIQASSYSLGQLVVGRIVAGLGVGGVTATAPNWQGECATAAHRGGVVVMEGLFALFGLALTGWIELGMSFVHNSSSWRFPLALSCLFALMVMVAIPFVPESPRWLVMKGRDDEARETLTALEDLENDSPKITKDIEEMKKSLEVSGRLGFRDAFAMGDQRLFHRLCICCAVQFFQQISGVNVLAYYETSIFLQIGLSELDSRILAASVFTFGTISTPIGVYTVDRYGRRPLLLIAAAGMGISMAALAACTSQPQSQVALGFACLFVFAFSFFFPIGFLGVSFLYAAEIAPLTLRVPITALSTATVWAINFMTVEVTPVGFATLGWQFYIIWACMNLCLIFPGVYFFFPETKGLSLEAIDDIFVNSKNAFQPVRLEKKMYGNAANATTHSADDDDEKTITNADTNHVEEKTTV